MTAVRDDLSQRTALSKSQLAVADICGQKAWLEIHHRRPFIPDEKTTFGSAVDAGVEAVLKAARAGSVVSSLAIESESRAAIERNGVEVDFDLVEDAIAAFIRDVQPKYDWSGVTLQRHLNAEIEPWGEVDGHPDVLLPGGVYDVKTSGRMKDTARTVELGLYALLAEAEGHPVAEVGYFCWVRTRKPYWQIISTPITPEFIAWTRERVDAYVRARNADVLLNRNAPEPVNWTFPSGPKNAGLCKGCQYNPMNGGDCRMAVTDGEAE
jgi:hypothetical protein